MNSGTGTRLRQVWLAWVVVPCLAATAGMTNAPAPGSYEAFEIIAKRNIFDPHPSNNKPPVVKAEPKVDAFTLVGTMSYEKGDFAFFDGTSAPFKKALKVGEEIAGYTVTEIATNGVMLKLEDQEIEFPLGKQFRRVNEGEWKLVKMKGTFTPPVTPLTPDTHGSTTRVYADAGDSEGSDKRQRKLARFSEDDVARIKELKESGDSKALKEFIVEQARAMGRPEKLSKFDKRAMKSQ